MSCHAFLFLFDSVCPVLLSEFRAVRSTDFSSKGRHRLESWAPPGSLANLGFPLTDLIYTTSVS